MHRSTRTIGPVRRIMTALLLAVGLMAVSGVIAAPASAGVDATGCTAYGCYGADGWGSGYGMWVSDGDKMWVCDSYPDGKSVAVMAVVEPGGPTIVKWHTTGANKCTERSFGNLPEGRLVVFFACLGNNLIVDESTCGDIKKAYA
ncbi:hypothetical protein F4553_000576 [Allocatelliglobosispora scoriae]|uniref:Secreted protein n=1 Tax=Allocatelliglobosispora scoriae TaxID=643052 RepID=A0A841BDL5_9ACTN|nr:hypothetical protein [Allocatelliglobosispora scoriae]MBB5867197.1 hypothetical protein [Allocatelliglobosispora scoriae]